MNRSASYQKLYYDPPMYLQRRRYSSSHSSSEDLLAQVVQQSRYGEPRIHIDPRYRDTRPIATCSNNSLNREYILGSNNSISRGGSFSGAAGGGGMRENPAITVEEYKEEEAEDEKVVVTNVKSGRMVCPRIEINNYSEEVGVEMSVDPPPEEQQELQEEEEIEVDEGINAAQELLLAKECEQEDERDDEESSWTDDVEDIPFIDDNDEDGKGTEASFHPMTSSLDLNKWKMGTGSSGILSDTRHRKLGNPYRKTVSFDLLLDGGGEAEDKDQQSQQDDTHKSNISAINKSKTCCEFFRETSTDDGGMRPMSRMSCCPRTTLTGACGAELGNKCFGTKYSCTTRRHHSLSGELLAPVSSSSTSSSSEEEEEDDNDVLERIRRQDEVNRRPKEMRSKGIDASAVNQKMGDREEGIDDARRRLLLSHQHHRSSSLSHNRAAGNANDRGSYCIYFDKDNTNSNNNNVGAGGASNKLNGRHFASDDELQHFDMNEMRLDLTELQSSSETSDANNNNPNPNPNNSTGGTMNGNSMGNVFRTYDDVVRSKMGRRQQVGGRVCPTPPYSASMDNIYKFDSGRGKVRALTKYFDQLERMKRARRRRQEYGDQDDHSTLQKFIGREWKRCRSQPDLLDPLENRSKLSAGERGEVLAQLQEWSEFGTQATEEFSYRVSCTSVAVDLKHPENLQPGVASMIVKITPEVLNKDVLSKMDDTVRAQSSRGRIGGGERVLTIDPTNLLEHFKTAEALPDAFVVKRPATCPHVENDSGKIQFSNPVTVNYQSSSEAAATKPSPRSRLFSFLTMRQVKRKKGKPSHRISRSETREATA